jgi:mono/diheme cytochrome c family protein
MEGGLQVLILASAAVLAALWPSNDRHARAQDNPPDNPPAATEQKAEQKVVPPEGNAARGRVSYRIYCASCHGALAKGDGEVGKYLKIPPTDLTRLAARNKGQFPTDRVYAAIDGRDAKVPVHGTRDMPVWGLSFQTEGKDTNQEAEVRGRILDLMTFLRTVQAEAAK